VFLLIHIVKKMMGLPVHRLTDIMTISFRKEKDVSTCVNLRQQVHSRHPLKSYPMVIVSIYELIEKVANKVFFVRSTEHIPCPCCGSTLKVIGSRRRVWYKSSGDHATLIIRRLRCQVCKKIHHELPDLIVPYKRYDVESLEGVLSKPERTDVAADESTIARWKRWFHHWSPYAAGCLQSISTQYDLPVRQSSESTGFVLHPFGRYIDLVPKWMCQVVRPIVNLHLWVTDPFCVPVLSRSG
jgi:hypothetical protein